MRPTSARLLAGAAVAAALLTGCGLDVLSSEEPELEAPPTDADDPYSDALAVGDTYEGDVRTTVIDIALGGAPAWSAAGEGFDWLWVKARTCVVASGSPAEIGWYQWAAVASDGSWYAADLDYADNRPRDQLPRLLELAPGDCREGRVLFAVPDEVEVVAIVNADRSGEPQGTWLFDDPEEQADDSE